MAIEALAAGGFMLVKGAFASLRPGTVKIILGPKSTSILPGKVGIYPGSTAGYCWCGDLYHTRVGTVVAAPPLILDDVLEYDVITGDIHLLAIHRGLTLPPPASPVELYSGLPPAPIRETLCNANCENPCNLNIWRRGAQDFWESVWRTRGVLVNRIPDFTIPPDFIWGAWTRRAYRPTLGRFGVPGGLGWRVDGITLTAMADGFPDLPRHTAKITPHELLLLLNRLHPLVHPALLFGLRG